MDGTELIARLRAWSRRYGPRSQERTLFLAAAERLEELLGGIEGEVAKRQAGGLTADAVEAAMGGRKLLPWQREALEG